MKRKKGQESALNATYLIVVIALLILAYILLLPESEKEKLISSPQSLGQGPIGDQRGPGINGYSGFRMLLSESPGMIYPPNNRGLTKQLASVNLFSTVESKREDLLSALTLASNILSADKKELSFKIDSLQNTVSSNLLFFVSESEGNLIVTLNGNEVFNDVPASSNMPIILPRAYLRQTNKLELSVSKPALIGSNRYIIKNIQVSVKAKQENSREIRTFVINQGERQSIQGLTLFYVVNCFTVEENGRLIIRLNGKVISDNLIVCDAGEVSLDLSKIDIIEGRNTLEFSIDKGKYVLERVLLEGALGPESAAYSTFTLQVQDLQDVSVGANVFLDLQFRKDGARKIATIFVNGFPLYLDTFDDKEEFEISRFVTDGRNSIRILPNVPIDVLNMNVVLG